MKNSISRREFINLLKVGGAATLGLSGCGRMSRYVTRSPYKEMPEYQLPGESVFYATTCRECPAACGLVVRTVEGRAVKIEGNPDHPVNRGKTCSRGQAALQGLYDPDRYQGPLHQDRSGSGQIEEIGWEEAFSGLAEALSGSEGDQLAVITGLGQDHVYDFLQEMSAVLGARPPLRYGALGMFEARNTLSRASQMVFGREEIPYFNLGQAEVVLSFGANFSETWLSPVAYNLAYGEMRQGHSGRRGILIQFESRMSQTAANADLWVPIRPGSEGLAAAGIGKLAAEILEIEVSPAYQRLDMEQVVTQTGISREMLSEIAALFAGAQRKTAVPGGAALGVEAGYETAVQILSLNLMQDDLLAGGVSFVPEPPLDTEAEGKMSEMEEIEDLIERMNRGEVTTLLVHGVDPVFELPHELGFEEALGKVKNVISFHSYPTDTASVSDLVLPDHTPLEGWGYQRKIVASDRMTVAGSQPVVAPLYETRAAVDVMLAALDQMDEGIREQISYRDEVDFLQKKLAPLMEEKGLYTAPVIEGFWSKFLQNGGWWTAEKGLDAGDLFAGELVDLEMPEPVFSLVERGLDEYYFLPYPMVKLGDGKGANRPWLQETPDSMTTVMWRSWLEINPTTAEQLGIQNDDVVEITTTAGTIRVAVYLFPGIRPDTIAIPFGNGHRNLGRFAGDSGENPLKVLPAQMNRVGDIVFASTLATIARTGDRHLLSRFESREGVYGEDEL